MTVYTTELVSGAVEPLARAWALRPGELERSAWGATLILQGCCVRVAVHFEKPNAWWMVLRPSGPNLDPVSADWLLEADQSGWIRNLRKKPPSESRLKVMTFVASELARRWASAEDVPVDTWKRARMLAEADLAAAEEALRQ